ncbi:MAG: right-handed parallel beta-helix repeat-containing protein [Gemmataceae bacterium]|nr:right-handed parallel beta-helix repeat-containing protein [Gemmataceae bacterium]
MSFTTYRRKWTNLFRSSSRKQRRAGAKPALQMVHLEDRITPATLLVDDDNTTYPVAFNTIQAAINAAMDGDTIQVADGTYNENVTITKNNLSLFSDNGRDSTTIIGTTGASLGTILIPTGIIGVQIGDINKGFHIVGIDGPTAGIEAGAVYVQGTGQMNLSIIGNEIEANGDHGLVSEFGATINGFVITDNIFSGQTFLGPNPAGVGFAAQNTLVNVPRQLVVIGNGGGGGVGSVTNLTFSNNQLTGTAGGISLTDDAGNPIAPTEQGNTLATIDVSNSTIENNSFEGTTTRFGSALRVRRGGTTITNNTFDGDGMGVNTSFVFVQNNSPQSISDIFNDNSFPDGAAFDAGTGTIVTVGGLQGIINAAAVGSTIIVAAGTYSGVTVPKPLTLVGAGAGQTILQGASPALIVNSPGVSISGMTFTTATDDPTILIQNNGSLTLRTSDVQESTGGFDRPAIRVDSGGALNLGVTGDLGNNTININGAGSLIDNADDTGISALGNTWQQDAATITNNFAIEDEINHALDAAGRGLVRYVAQNVYVTTNSGSIQRGVNASVNGDTVNVSAGSYAGGILIDRTLTITGTGSPTVTSADLNGQNVGFQYAANNGILQGFNIVAGGTGNKYGVLLSDKNSGPGYTGGTVQNNSFNNLDFAIATADGAFDYSNATIQNNVITIGTGTWGIYLTAGGGGHFVYGNNISGGAGTAGILVQFIDNVTIGGTGAGQGNTITGTIGAVLVADANNVSFIGNTVSGVTSDRGSVRVEGNVNGFTINQNSITGGIVPAIRVRQAFSPTPNSNITANNNFLTGNSYAIQVDADGLGTTLDARFNDMSGNTTGSILNNDVDSIVNASGSYFGSSVLATVSAGITGSVDYTPYLNLGTDTSAAAGFQGDFSDLTVHAAGAQVGATGRVQEGVNAIADGSLTGAARELNVAAGTYTENVVLNKPLTMLGAQAGVDARGRVAAESIITPLVPAVRTLELQTGVAGSTIDGFNFAGGSRGIESTSGTLNSLSFVNNIISGFTGSAVFLNDNGTDITVNQNVFDGSSQVGSGAVFHLDQDSFNGFVFTNNNVVNGGIGNTGFFVDGNHNVGPSLSRNPLISGNLISGNQTGMNLGRFAFTGGSISNNVFSFNDFDGLQGGIQNSIIAQNTFTVNGRSGLALTGFGGAGDPTRGAQNNTITENFFSANAVEDLLYSSGQFPGTISTNNAFNNSFGSATAITYSGTEIINNSRNAFGSASFSTVSAKINSVNNKIDFTPYITNSADASAAAGFQGDFSDLTVHAAGAQAGMTGRITEGYNALDASGMGGGVLRVIAGTYTDDIDLTAMGDKEVTLAPGSSPGQVTVNGNLTLSANDTLEIEIGGLNAASDYDNLIVNGTVTLGGATLDVQQFAGFTLSTLVAQSFTIIDNDGTDLVMGEFFGLPEGEQIVYAGGILYITYQGGDGNDVVLNNYPVINGTANGDTVTITPTATGYDYTLNGNPTVSVVGTIPFAFNGLGGDDTMIVNLNANPIPTIFYDGGDQDTPANAGANTVFGDVLVVVDTAMVGTHTVTYTGAGTLPMTGGFAGTVAVMGENTINFTGLEPVDIVNMAVVNITFANADDAITIAEGLDSATNSLAALVVSGTSGGVAFEQVHLRNNAQVNIDTTTVVGNDTIEITGAANTHGNANLSITTGGGTDSVSVTGAATFSGTLSIATGAGADTVTISAAINGTSASVSTAGDADSIVVSATGTAPLTLDGGAAGDSYTVNVGTLVGTVAVADTGAGVGDSLTVNGTSGVDTFEVNTATGGNATVAVNTTQIVTYTNTIETLNLDGGDDADTYNVFFAQGVGSFLPATVNIADTGMTAGDVANVSGTDNADSIDVNFTATRTTTLGGESVRYVNGNLETLNVFSKAGNDVVFAKAVSLPGGPVVNLNGGSPSNPTPLPGDILVLDVTGMMGLNTSNIKTPAGSVTSSSHNALSWVDFETIPTPIGLGGTFDFGTKTSPVQVGPYVVPPPGSYWVGVSNTDTYASKGYYGWTSPVNSTDRGAASPNPTLTTFHNVLRDSNWFGPLNVTGTFNVAVAAGDYQVSVTIGDTAVVMDSIFVTIEGLATPIAVQKGLQGQFSTVTGIGSDANADGKIAITIVDKAGTHSYWHVNAIDVRPVGLVSPVTITPVGGVGTKVADGLSTTSYTAAGFFPNAIVTIDTTGGKITTTDVDPFLLGVQVKADASGVATFDLQHPTGNADVTLTASAAIVVDAKGTFTQSFTLTPSQKIDFNSATSPTEPGYLGVSNALYAGTASNGLGWQGPVSLGDRGAASGTALFRDFVFNLQGAANAGTFVIDLPTGAPHVITVYLGDPATARDRMQIEVADSPTTFAPVSQALTEIRSLKTNSLSFTVTPYANGGTFQTRLRFSDLGGTQNGWSVQGIEYRTLASQGVLGVTPVAPVMGNGTAVTNYVITGGAVGGLVTLSSQFGAIQGTDASALYDGFQVQLDGSGGGSFTIQSPVVAAGTLASKVSLVAVNGSHAATFTQDYMGAKVRYDFGSSVLGNVATGFTYLSGSQIATAQNGVGFKAVAGEYDRNPTTYPNVSKTSDPALFRDAVSGAGSGTFRVLVGTGATDVPVKVYSYDAFSSRGPITVTAEGGTKQTLTPSMTTPAVYNVVGSDTDMDGFLDITVSGNAIWMMNGIEVG